MPGGFYGTFMGQIQAFYYSWMGLGWGWIVIAQIFYGAWNLINDPIFSYLQDITRRKDGRYIPWIKYSSPLFTVAFILVFFPPDTWRFQVTGGSYEIPLFFWYIITQCLFDTFFTIVYGAHTALMPQMTMDERERTKVSIFSALMGLLGGAASFAVPLVFLTNPTAGKIQAFRVFVIIFGILALIPFYLAVRWIKERHEYIPEKKISFWASLKAVFKNPSGRIYIIYDGLSVGFLNFLFTGITFVFSWSLGINDYHAATNPNWTFWNLIPYLIGPLVALALGVYFSLKIPNSFGKDIKTALWFMMVMVAIGMFIAFLGVLPNPNAPPDEYWLPDKLWLFSIGFSIAAFGLPGEFIYHNPMRAETIDYDEYVTGERREAIYAGVGCIFSKPMISVALAGVPAIIGIFGLVPADPTDPVGAALVVSTTFNQAITGVAVACFLVPSILAAICAVIWYWYPLGRKKMNEIRAALEKIHDEKRKLRLDDEGVSKFVL
ncbi:MAG: MFS transporter [Candidatus Hodarchaeota archaeon]